MQQLDEAALAECRKAFEEWFAKFYSDENDSNDSGKSNFNLHSWWAWQAAWNALPTREAAGDVDEAVWAACPAIRMWTEDGRKKKCERCPAKEASKYGESTRACRRIAEEIVIPALSAAPKPHQDTEWKVRALQKELWEIEQILGKALGYPWYKDDVKNFPDATEADGVATGEHTPVTIAMEAARRLTPKPMGEDRAVEKAEVERMLKYLRDMRERRAYTNMVMAYFFGHWHELIENLAESALTQHATITEK